MNCQPGDLAVCVRVPNPAEECYIGRIYKVIEASLEPDGEWCWSAENETHLLMDSCLKPLRDSGGTDETLLWLPVPGSEDSLRKQIDEKLWEMLK